MIDPAEHDDEGNWTGTCAECATSHDGYHPDTLGGRMRCLRAQAEALGADHLVDQADTCQREFDRRRGRDPPLPRPDPVALHPHR